VDKKRFREHIIEQLSEENIAKAVGEYNLMITPEGLLENSSAGEKLIKWSDIDRVERAKHHVYFYLTDVAAIIIPKKTVSEDSNFKAFYDETIEALKAAKTNAS